ncbi:glycosyltransferase [Marinobacter sp. KMM 10035]|uniref:glycosyltransferase n=1 Tax=Marinobacter sp. KMM 10035 TaxID=3134034 RepID=UPI0039788ED4
MDRIFISVIVPAHNEQDHLAQCLQALMSQDYPKNRYEVIVVDNNSTDSTRKIALSFGVKIIDQKKGPVGAVRNVGASQAAGEFLAFIDADCVAPKNWLSKGAHFLVKPNSVYGGGCDLPTPPHWIEQAWLLESKFPPKDLLGCCIFIKKADFFDIGLFDERVTSGEDTKLSKSLKKQSYNVIMTKQLNVIHLGNPATLRRFALRQVWHSENYIQNWPETKLDPTFYLLLLFLFGLLCLFLPLGKDGIFGYLTPILLVVGTPLLFTIKRLRRSKNPKNHLRNLPFIYFLDFVYLCGRIFGLAKSTCKALKASIARQTQLVD